jgi:hypothetical protein
VAALTGAAMALLALFFGSDEPSRRGANVHRAPGVSTARNHKVPSLDSAFFFVRGR